MPLLRSTLKRAAALDHDADVMLGNQLHMMDNSVKINEQMAIGADQLKQHDLLKAVGTGSTSPKDSYHGKKLSKNVEKQNIIRDTMLKNQDIKDPGVESRRSIVESDVS